MKPCVKQATVVKNKPIEMLRTKTNRFYYLLDIMKGEKHL